jgi:hypothetical protein
MKAPPAPCSAKAFLSSRGHTSYARCTRCTTLTLCMPASLLFFTTDVTIAGKVLAHSHFSGLLQEVSLLQLSPRSRFPVHFWDDLPSSAGRGPTREWRTRIRPPVNGEGDAPAGRNRIYNQHHCSGADITLPFGCTACSSAPKEEHTR